MHKSPIPLIKLGRTGREVTRVGLGGEGVLRTNGRGEAAEAVIRGALSEGMTYFDSARVYRDSELYYGRVWKQNPELRANIFQTSKSACRDRAGALRDLDETLSRLKTDHLDLWQIHDVRTMEEVREISGMGGALEAFLEARDQGRVRHIGVTGHHDPRVLTQAVKEWPVDAVLMPVNPVEELIGGFMTDTLTAAREKGIAVIGMKILGAGHYNLPKFGVTAELLIRYALTVGVDVAIVGCSTAGEAKELADAGRSSPLTGQERRELLRVYEPYTRRLAFYRGTI